MTGSVLGSFEFDSYNDAITQRKGWIFQMKNTARNFARMLLVLILAVCMMTGIAFAEGTDPYFQAGDLFTDRDLEQSAKMSKAESFTVSDGSEIRITAAGTYVLTGSASDATVYVEASDDDKVQLVLDGLTVTNKDFPCIYVVSADKTFITLNADSSLSVTEAFRTDGETDVSGVIFSKDDLVLNGTASLTISSSGSGVFCKDDLKITGGAYEIQAASKALDAKDSIRIAGGTFILTAGKDALHTENKKDDSKGYIYIGGGSFTISADDDGIFASTVLQMDGGEMTINAPEGIESTVIQINGGTVNITSTEKGINAAEESSSYTPSVFFNGGETTIICEKGKCVNSAGDIYVNGGTVSVTGEKAFDYDSTGAVNGGTVTVNGEEAGSI